MYQNVIMCRNIFLPLVLRAHNYDADADLLTLLGMSKILLSDLKILCKTLFTVSYSSVCVCFLHDNSKSNHNTNSLGEC